jgi:hypothetical protein
MVNCRDKIYKSLLPHWTGIQGKGSEAVRQRIVGCRTLERTITSPYLIVNSEVQLSTPRERDGMGKVSPFG